MTTRTNKTIYWITTGLLSVMMLMSIGMYFFKHADVSEVFTKLGFPTYIIYPLAIAKLLGLVAIWTNKIKALKDWAYAGFFFNFILAIAAHIMINDGEHFPAIVALVLLLISYMYSKKLLGEYAS